MTHSHRPPGITALSFFFLFGTVMSGLAAIMLLMAGGPANEFLNLGAPF